MKLIIQDETGNEIESISIIQADIDEVKKVINKRLNKEAKAKLPKKPKPLFVELGNVDFGNFIFDEDGEFNLECVAQCLDDEEYISWDDRTGEKDNKLPFRILINNKYLVQFEVGQGECIEATWEHRIWGGECLNIQLISTDETVADVEKAPSPVIEELAPIVLAEDEIMLLGQPTKVLKTFDNPFKLVGITPYWLDDTAHATCEPWENVDLENGAVVYEVKELQNVLIFKLNPGDENYYLSPLKNKYKEIIPE